MGHVSTVLCLNVQVQKRKTIVFLFYVFFMFVFNQIMVLISLYGVHKMFIETAIFSYIQRASMSHMCDIKYGNTPKILKPTVKCSCD